MNEPKNIGRAVAQAISRWLPTANFSIIIITRGWQCRVDPIGLDRSSGEGETPTVLGLLERANLDHSGDSAF
jgi:hypothetical protein